MATIGHQCARTGRWEVLGAVDADAFRMKRDGRCYEVTAFRGTIEITCACGWGETVCFSSDAVVSLASSQKSAVL